MTSSRTSGRGDADTAGSERWPPRGLRRWHFWVSLKWALFGGVLACPHAADDSCAMCGLRFVSPMIVVPDLERQGALS